MAERDLHADESTADPGGIGDDALPSGLLARIRRDPVRAPEHIALIAARRLAPAAEAWAAEERPGRSETDLARLAVRRHVRAARVEGAVLGIGGVVTAIPDLVALAWIQSRMVFFIAAAFGFDPHHRMRPAELLALLELYSTPAEARAALDGLGRPLALQYFGSRLSRDEALFRRLLAFVGRRAAERFSGRLLPLLAAPVGAIQNGGATASLGARALVYYGGDESFRDLAEGTAPAR